MGNGSQPERGFNVGDLVWYLRPPNTGDKLDSRWLGPAEVVERKSKRGYAIRVKPGFVMDAPLAFLKKYVPDVYSGQGVLMHFHKRTTQETPLAPVEYVVDRIVGHKQLQDGTWRFLTKWVGNATKLGSPFPVSSRNITRI